MPKISSSGVTNAAEETTFTVNVVEDIAAEAAEVTSSPGISSTTSPAKLASSSGKSANKSR